MRSAIRNLKAGVGGIIGVFVFLFGIAQNAEAVQYYITTETVDSDGSVGIYNSIAVDSSGKAYISYYDDINSALKYATNAGGSWATQIVDNSGFVGTYTSLALDGAGKAYISYHDGSIGAIRYATNAGGSWDIQTAASGVGSSGSTTSIALDGSGKAYISYIDNSNSDLRYATNAGGSWGTEMVDNGLVGNYASLALDGSGKAYIIYQDGSTGNLKYTTNAGGSWLTQTADGTGIGGSYNSIALDSSGKAYISYYDSNPEDLKYATNASGSWVIQTIDSVGNVGWTTSIALDSNGKAHISYNDLSNTNLKYAAVEIGNLLLGLNTDVVLTGDFGVPVTASSITVTGDGRLVKAAATSTEADFLVASFVGDVYSRMALNLQDAVLSGTATLVFDYTDILSNPDFIATGFGEEHLKVFHLTGGGGVEELPIISRNLAANTITVTTTGFSDFGVGVNPEPATLLLLLSALLGLPLLRKK